MLACGVALLCALLLMPVGAVGKKKKGIAKWWGTFEKVGGPMLEPRPGVAWDVTYTLNVSKGKRTWSLTDAVGRYNCWDLDEDTNLPVATLDHFEFPIPALAGKVAVQKRPLDVWVPESFTRIPTKRLTASVSGQSESGRGFEGLIAPYGIELSGKRWRVAWKFTFQCDGGAEIAGHVRPIPTFAARR